MNKIAVFLIQQALQKMKENKEYVIMDNTVVHYRNKNDDVSIKFDPEQEPMIVLIK